MATTKKKKTTTRSKTQTAKRKPQAESTGLYTAGFVLGIVGVVFAFIPLCYWIAYILGGLALIFGIIGLTKKIGGYQPIAATVLGAIAVIVGIVMNITAVRVVNEVVDTWSDAVDEAWNSVMDNYESEVVGKYADVEILGYQEVDDVWSDHALVVKVTNISDETRSFSIGIEAVDEDGNRLDESSFYAENLAPGQSGIFNTFTLSKLGTAELENATFRVYRSSTY